MKKIVLFLGTACLALNTFAVELSDLNSAMGRANQPTAQVPAKMIYGGKDVISPKQAALNSAQTTLS